MRPLYLPRLKTACLKGRGFRPYLQTIKTVPPLYWKKIIANDDIWNDGIIQVLFADGTTLKLLFSHFSQQKTPKYQEIAKSLLEKINKYYY